MLYGPNSSKSGFVGEGGRGGPGRSLYLSQIASIRSLDAQCYIKHRHLTVYKSGLFDLGRFWTFINFYTSVP